MTLPCNIGDTFYICEKGELKKCKVESVIKGDKNKIYVRNEKRFFRLGHEAFFTEAEAKRYPIR